MKKIKMFLIIILLLVVWIGVDRYRNITSYLSNDSITMLTITDSVWTNIPDSKYIQLDSRKFKPLNSTLYVEEFNPVLRTWNHVLGTDTSYNVKDSNDRPMMVHVFARDIDLAHEYEFDYDLFQKETINDLTIYYGIENNDTYVVRFDNKECTILFFTNKTNLNELKSTLYEIYDQLKK